MAASPLTAPSVTCERVIPKTKLWSRFIAASPEDKNWRQSLHENRGISNHPRRSLHKPGRDDFHVVPIYLHPSTIHPILCWITTPSPRPQRIRRPLSQRLGNGLCPPLARGHRPRQFSWPAPNR